jgi:hypothetical protein
MLVIGRWTARWDRALDMRMHLKILPPGVQDAEEADLGAEMFGIGGDLEQSRGAWSGTRDRKQPFCCAKTATRAERQIRAFVTSGPAGAQGFRRQSHSNLLFSTTPGPRLPRSKPVPRLMLKAGRSFQPPLGTTDAPRAERAAGH